MGRRRSAPWRSWNLTSSATRNEFECSQTVRMVTRAKRGPVVSVNAAARDGMNPGSPTRHGGRGRSGCFSDCSACPGRRHARSSG